MRISDWSSDVCSSDLPAQNLGKHPLPRNDVVQPRYGQQNHAHDHTSEIQPGAFEETQHQLKGNAYEQAKHKGGHSQCQAGPHALADFMSYVSAHVRKAEKIGSASCMERVCQNV